MPKLNWDAVGERFYETGTDHGVLYKYDSAGKKYLDGVAWNGLTAVNSTPSGAEPSPLYADNIKYVNMMSKEEYGGTIEAYTYPDEFASCDGTAVKNGVGIGQQTRDMFAFSWRTLIGNDTEGTDHGYRIHIAYSALAQPSEKAYSTVNDSPEAMTLSWTFSTTPIPFPDDKNPDKLKPTSYIYIDSTDVTPESLKQVEDALYGSESGEAKLLMPWEILEMAQPAASQGA